jgi:hypothetical protein
MAGFNLTLEAAGDESVKIAEDFFVPQIEDALTGYL